MTTEKTLLPHNIKGAKWFNAAEYISEADRQAVFMKVQSAIETMGTSRGVGVRPASYTGEPHPVACVTVDGGAHVYGYVYKQREN